MRNKKFKGYLGKLIQEHLELRRGLGRDYRSNEHTLLKFNQMVQRRWPHARTVTKNMVMTFLRASRDKSPATRKLEITYLRMFSMDLCMQGKAAFVPERKLVPRSASHRTRIHIITHDEVKRLMIKAANLGGIAKEMYPTLIGLLWVTGLRLMEAQALKIGDIDLKQRLLYVKRGKFGKSRVIPLSSSASRALCCHVDRLANLGLSTDGQAPLFLTKRFGAMKSPSVRALSGTLHNLFRRAEIKTSWGGYPRAHDLRHSFATRSLQALKRQGEDPSSSIPALASVMGHSHIAHTQVYLHPSMETLEVASKAFERKLLKFRSAA